MAVLAPSSHILCRDLLQRDQQHHPSNGGGCSAVTVQSSGLVWEKTRRRRRRWLRGGGEVKAMGFWQGLTRPSSMEMEPISCMEDLDRALQQSQELSRPILIDWMASWCRKCIYLKPKLEKLAAELHPRIKFYCVDVNNVPQALVKRGNITKMPTIQLWKDGEWKAEIIGGHKAWLVMDEVREMIQKHL